MTALFRSTLDNRLFLSALAGLPKLKQLDLSVNNPVNFMAKARRTFEGHVVIWVTSNLMTALFRSTLDNRRCAS